MASSGRGGGGHDFIGEVEAAPLEPDVVVGGGRSGRNDDRV